ncbi:MAG: isocitrate lyase/PEP mutase family protein [Candidatus Binataceae bacterium]
MDLESQRKKAERLLRLHDREHILVLPNAWDAASARIFELTGFNAVATTSAGVAYTAGYPDGERIPREDMLTIVRWIARCVEVPVTADIEAGFAQNAGGVAATVRALIEAGAVGVNLEDSVHGGERRLYEISEAVERLRAAREVANESGVPLVINARTDVFLRGIGDKSGRFDHAVQRLNAYRRAGADCLYPIGFFDADTIARLVKAVDGPINVMGLAGMPTVAEMERLGVARVSTASGPCRVAMAATSRAASALMRDGSFDIFADLMSHQEANRLFDKRA